ncbi:MAG: patatin-like phospholipase family protein [Hyphomicrobiales bacterium]|nr:patatin-like phospholipase family protein [Hyphomicrobiales bacterium]
MSLALQGGGSFGAFTWGVLDRLLEADELALDSISGASAGAVNAVLLASGLAEGGRAGARQKLQRFWRRMSDAASFLPLTAFPAGLAPLARALSPYHFNPFDLNPLRRALASEVDFERLNSASEVRLLVAATRVADGSLRIFRSGELSIDAVLASACLPTIHRTIEIDGEGYWDGGYVANPPLIQLVHESDAEEILIVQVTPNRVAQAPITPREIEKRLGQIAFNAPLNAEIEALKLAASLGATPKLRQLRIARVAAEDEIDDLAQRNAADLGWPFLESLRDAGRQAAQTWLDERVGTA